MGGTAVHAAQYDEPCFTLDQRSNAGSIERTFDEVALPMSRPLPRFDLLRPMNDAQFLRHEALARKGSTGGAARRLLLAKRLDHRLLESTSGMGIDRGVNRFVADALVGIVWMHVAESGSNLLRRPASIDPLMMHMPVQRTAFAQLTTPCSADGEADRTRPPGLRRSAALPHSDYEPVREKPSKHCAPTAARSLACWFPADVRS